MIYEVALLAGVALLSKTLLDEALDKEINVRKRKVPKKSVKKVKRLSDFTDQEKWEYFVKVKDVFEESKGTVDEPRIEEYLVRAEKSLQNPEKGFYVGDAVELGLESGVAKRMPLYFKWANLSNHYIFYGTTRVGKSRALANHARQFIKKGYNVFVVDPKGGEKHEILGWVCEAAHEANRIDDLLYYNPVYPTLTDYFNPCFGKENDELASEMKLYAQGAGDPDNFFIQKVGQVTKGIATACDYLERVRDIDGSIVKAQIQEEIKKYMVSRLTNGHKVVFNKKEMIMNPDVAYRSTSRGSEQTIRTFEEGVVKRKLMTFKDFAYYAMYDNLTSLKGSVLGTPIPILDNPELMAELTNLRDEALLQLEGAAGTSKEHYENTTGSLIELLTKLSTGSIGKMFCTTPINPMAMRLASKEKGVIAIIQPNPLKYQSVSEMIMKIFLKNLENIGGNIGASGRALKRKTIVIIDEASKAMFPGIEELFNKLGGLGISFGLYTQSQNDMVMMLGKDTSRVITTNINTIGYMKDNDPLSRKEASENFGEMKVVDIQMQTQGGVGGAGRAGVTSELKRIAHADSFDGLGIGEALVKHKGSRYLVELPFQPDPRSYMIMPSLQSEVIANEMNEFQSLLENKLFYYQRDMSDPKTDEYAA